VIPEEEAGGTPQWILDLDSEKKKHDLEERQPIIARSFRFCKPSFHPFHYFTFLPFSRCFLFCTFFIFVLLSFLPIISTSFLPSFRFFTFLPFLPSFLPYFFDLPFIFLTFLHFFFCLPSFLPSFLCLPPFLPFVTLLPSYPSVPCFLRIAPPLFPSNATSVSSFLPPTPTPTHTPSPFLQSGHHHR
jgi:hypothetical protein